MTRGRPPTDQWRRPGDISNGGEKMKLGIVMGAAALALTLQVAHAAENPAEVDAVVAAAKAADPNLCKGGQASISAAVSTQVRAMAQAGKIKGNPQAVGAEAGQKIGRSCAGG
jgi:hypothetical protein